MVRCQASMQYKCARFAGRSRPRYNSIRAFRNHLVWSSSNLQPKGLHDTLNSLGATCLHGNGRTMISRRGHNRSHHSPLYEAFHAQRQGNSKDTYPRPSFSISSYSSSKLSEMAAVSGLQTWMVAGTRSGGGRVVKLVRPSRIRCQAEDREPKPAAETPSPVMPSPPTPPAAPKVSTKFGDVLAFSGPAPERINGRLAMVGFASAMAVELASGNDLATQLAVGGLPWFLWATGLLSVASLVPLFKGVSAESVSGGVMSSNAETWNGRMAMLGLVALALTEYLKGGPIGGPIV